MEGEREVNYSITLTDPNDTTKFGTWTKLYIITISLSFQRMKSKIMQEYGRQRDQGYPEMRREYQYLHLKLAHIKGLVTKYDEMQVQVRS